MRARHKETATHARPRGPGRASGRPARAAVLALAALAGATTGCRDQPSGDGPLPGGSRPSAVVQVEAPAGSAPVEILDAPATEALTLELSRVPVEKIVALVGHPDAAERRAAARALGRAGGDDAAQAAATLLRDPDPAVREEACFAIGVSGSKLAPGLLGPLVESKAATPAEIAAAISGLARTGDDAAGDLLLRLALREDLPVEAPEALLRHVRRRGKPWPGPLPDERLLRYETHASPRGRAGLGWIGRIWRDSRVIPALERLTKDADPAVRRAVASALAEGFPDAKRLPADAERTIAALRALAADPDAGVAVSAVRSLASYDRDDSVVLLRQAVDHPVFLVRTAAVEGLGARKAAAGWDDVARAATKDTSPSVRAAAAAAALEIDPVRAQELADALLGSPSDFVRAAGAGVVAKSKDNWVPERLAGLFGSDTSVRVKEAALEGLRGHIAPAALEAARSALEGTDPQLAGIAADVAMENGWMGLLPAMRKALARFEGTAGADARESIASVLLRAKDPADDGRVRKIADEDADPGPRTAARAALAERAKQPAPEFDRRPRREGAAPPLGAKLLARDVDLIVETDQGTMRIRLDSEGAPLHAAHLADLAAKGFYDGLTWHRVVPDFVIQGGCPRGDGAGNAGVNLPLEPTRTPFERGTLGMPRSSHPDTGGCQLFICHSRAPHLDVEYSAIGRVVEGLDVIDRIDVGSKIVRVRVAGAR